MKTSLLTLLPEEIQRPNLYLFSKWIDDNIIGHNDFMEKIEAYAQKKGTSVADIKGWARIGQKISTDPQIKNTLAKFVELTSKKLNEDEFEDIANANVEDDTPIIEPKQDQTPLAASTDEMTNKFPKLRDTLVELMTEDFKVFIKNILWIAPRPTTFKVVLINEQYFYLTWFKLTFVAQVEGKKYYLLNLNEEERATKAIADLLKLGNANELSSMSGDLKAAKKPKNNQQKEEFPFEDPGVTPEEPNDQGLGSQK